MVDHNFSSSEGGVPEERFADLFEKTVCTPLQGSIAKGTVIALERDNVVIDVGLKSEGCVPLKEFSVDGRSAELAVGDLVDVFIERYEDRGGSIVLSREKALKEVVWKTLEKSFAENTCVTGKIFSKVKGGFIVDLEGMMAFLPGSQIDVRPIRDVAPLMNTDLSFHILKMDRLRGGTGNIVVSRRTVLEETGAEERAQLMMNLQEGQVIPGTVRNITSYGAFVDIGGVDGLLHNADISWKRIGHASELLKPGQVIQVKILKFNPETQRISLGTKQLEPDPWETLDDSFVVGARIKGVVTNVTEYGVFVEVKEGVEGLVYVSDVSWKKNASPTNVASIGQELEAVILDMDQERRRMGLGLKQLTESPWVTIERDFPVGTEFESVISNIVEFGLFVRVVPDVDGLVHANDLSWEVPGEEALKSYKRGDTIKIKVLEIDGERERISLGVKQLAPDPQREVFAQLKKGSVVTCTIVELKFDEIEVTLSNGVLGSIKKAELSKEREERHIDRFAVGEKLDAKVLAINKAQRRVSLSVRALEIAEEKQAIAEYGSSDSGASLGEILGAVIAKTKQKGASAPAESPVAEPEKKSAAAKSKKKPAAESKKATAAESKLKKSAVKSEASSAAKPKKKPTAEPKKAPAAAKKNPAATEAKKSPQKRPQKGSSETPT
ncbi:MAG: 30S ribosomal protein S1 [Holosporales bacterium]|jgi:small subunit ribosomal protein S1|nr:30S ribosomal protein S1 [Holosporales bacterium]